MPWRQGWIEAEIARGRDLGRAAVFFKCRRTLNSVSGKRRENRPVLAGCRFEIVFSLDFALGKGSNDCRAGNHSHKCESHQNVVHL
jgi:hypothetical protein